MKINKLHLGLAQFTWLLTVASAATLGLSLLHPFGNVKTVRPELPLLHAAQVDLPVMEVFERSCQNCHSERTTWPWYSYIAPGSWLVEKDVRDGREHWNMSKWDSYDTEQKTETLSRIGSMVRNRKMPLSHYLLLHPEAKLSDADVNAIYNWTRSERRRLKSLRDSGAVPASAPPAR